MQRSHLVSQNHFDITFVDVKNSIWWWTGGDKDGNAGFQGVSMYMRVHVYRYFYRPFFV